MAQKTYKGSCHCQNVKYEVNLELGKVISCNCSICQRKGALLAFVPAEQFKLLQGREFLSNYQFGQKRIHHLFCKNCGVSSFSEAVGPDGKAMRAINVRCLEGVDPMNLEVQQYNGKDA